MTKPIRSVEHAVNSLRKRGYIVKYHEYYDPVLECWIKGYVVVPNDGTLWDFNTLPHYFGVQLIDIAEQKRLEPYREDRRDEEREQPDHYDMLQALLRTNIEQNKILREMRQEIESLRKEIESLKKRVPKKKIKL